MDSLVGQQALTLQDEPEPLPEPVGIRGKGVVKMFTGRVGNPVVERPGVPVMIGKDEFPTRRNCFVEVLECFFDFGDITKGEKTGDDIEAASWIEPWQDRAVEVHVREIFPSSAFPVLLKDGIGCIVSDDGCFRVLVGNSKHDIPGSAANICVSRWGTSFREEFKQRVTGIRNTRTRIYLCFVFFGSSAPVIIPVDRLGKLVIGHSLQFTREGNKDGEWKIGWNGLMDPTPACVTAFLPIVEIVLTEVIGESFSLLIGKAGTPRYK